MHCDPLGHLSSSGDRIKAGIMAGGLGSRRRPVTTPLAKPLTPVGRPALIESRMAPARRVVTPGSIDGAQVRILVEAFRDRLGAWRKEAA